LFMLCSLPVVGHQLTSSDVLTKALCQMQKACKVENCIKLNSQPRKLCSVGVK
jgi:hypothetical protein